MSALPLVHGASGILDELLSCGFLLAAVLLIYFFTSARRSQHTADGADVRTEDK